ncbi:MAG TPA: DUF4097 family beta strand repeat-containing protein [Gemmatimonadaceae bacterium]|nr:DUF4097 family beta strand repeat-containing protein [Gemmatimonadaceae bacterium]
MRTFSRLRLIGTMVPLLGIALSAEVGQAQQRRSAEDFSWTGMIPSGRRLYIRNLNGSIRVERATGDRAEVTGVKRWRRGDPADVKIEMRKVGSGEQDVIVCAIWTERTECDEDGYDVKNDRDWWGGRDNRNDVSVEFTVRLPAGVRLITSTVNGGLDIEGATSSVEASTVNGEINAASTGGPVQASTVNGSIEVRMREMGTETLDFSTVNGSITVYVPDNINAELEMRTVNGRVSSDFPLQVQGRINPRRLRATLGRGGQRIEFSTVNGSVELRKN